jgi:hypothetical protein
MDLLDQARQQLDALLDEIQTRERDVAAAAEHLSQDDAVRAAWRQGGHAMRGRILLLIDQQLTALGRAGMNRGLLTALRRQVEVEEHG